jgi:hypothetical protein
VFVQLALRRSHSYPVSLLRKFISWFRSRNPGHIENLHPSFFLLSSSSFQRLTRPLWLNLKKRAQRAAINGTIMVQYIVKKRDKWAASHKTITLHNSRKFSWTRIHVSRSIFLPEFNAVFQCWKSILREFLANSDYIIRFARLPRIQKHSWLDFDLKKKSGEAWIWHSTLSPFLSFDWSATVLYFPPLIVIGRPLFCISFDISNNWLYCRSEFLGSWRQGRWRKWAALLRGTVSPLEFVPCYPPTAK